jgi:hypothetical protein
LGQHLRVGRGFKRVVDDAGIDTAVNGADPLGAVGAFVLADCIGEFTTPRLVLDQRANAVNNGIDIRDINCLERPLLGLNTGEVVDVACQYR